MKYQIIEKRKIYVSNMLTTTIIILIEVYQYFPRKSGIMWLRRELENLFFLKLDWYTNYRRSQYHRLHFIDRYVSGIERLKS